MADMSWKTYHYNFWHLFDVLDLDRRWKVGDIRTPESASILIGSRYYTRGLMYKNCIRTKTVRSSVSTFMFRCAKPFSTVVMRGSPRQVSDGRTCISATFGPLPTHTDCLGRGFYKPFKQTKWRDEFISISSNHVPAKLSTIKQTRLSRTEYLVGKME